MYSQFGHICTRIRSKAVDGKKWKCKMAIKSGLSLPVYRKFEWIRFDLQSLPHKHPKLPRNRNSWNQISSLHHQIWCGQLKNLLFDDFKQINSEILSYLVRKYFRTLLSLYAFIIQVNPTISYHIKLFIYLPGNFCMKKHLQCNATQKLNF